MSKRWSPDDLQPGDPVCVLFGDYTERGRMSKVDRLTERHVVVEGLKYRRTSGVQASTSYEVRTLADPESKRAQKALAETRRYVAWIELSNRWKSLSRASKSERDVELLIAAAAEYLDTVRVEVIEP